MVNALEAPVDKLLDKLATYIKENVPEVKPPPWASFAKTGSHKEKPPFNQDWWYKRAASILRKLYKNGSPTGLAELRREYGGRKRRGVRPERSVEAPGNAIRKILQQLESAGLVRRTRRGRVLTPQGKALLDRLAYDVLVEEARVNPELAKYLPESVRVKISA
ncbi:MAG: 30S ribosomal protein S19e [Thermosphaera sp.]